LFFHCETFALRAANFFARGKNNGLEAMLATATVVFKNRHKLLTSLGFVSQFSSHGLHQRLTKRSLPCAFSALTLHSAAADYREEWAPAQ
jgi:hypothetical protein